MTTHYEQLKARFQELTHELLHPSLESNKRHLLQKELSEITLLLNKYDQLRELDQKIAHHKQHALANQDAELAALFQEEEHDLVAQKAQAQKELDELLFPPDELDNRSVYLEVRAGTGGQEAALFATNLLEMYKNYAHHKGWKAKLESVSTTDLGGIREAILHIEGKNVYGHLKHESGVHRVQRVPVTETGGRIHTSTATVAVLPEAQEVDVSIVPSDLRIDVFRASGAGGQHVNTTDSAVRITHIPSGIVISCQDERSQHKNKAKALKILQSRLLAHQREKQAEELSKQRKEQVGSAMRSEKVRTYNFPQNRVTDHQVSLTLNKLDRVIAGELDEIIEALREKERINRKKILS
jgi:peptide chain release factor 1